ncbi:MAG: hypothetical protein Q4C75_06120, partial [Bergeyella zoohelcum]|nr:hypothetical protein [Bergeyella zoohelcum]
NGYNIPLKVVVPVQVNGNQIALPNYIKYPFAERFRGYDVDYELVVPTRMKVINQDDTISLYEDEDDNQSTHHGSMNLNHNDLSINIDSDKDSATVNGKKVSKQEAQKLMDSITADFNFDDLKPHTEKQEF